MATKQFLTLDGLTRYDELLKGVMSVEDAKSIKYVSVSGNTVSFFKSEDGSGTAAFQVEIPDVSGFMSKLASATGGKIVTSTATGEVAESGTAISDLMPKGAWGSTGYIMVSNDDGTIDVGDLSVDNIVLRDHEDSWDGGRVAITNDDGTISEGSISPDAIATWETGSGTYTYITTTDGTGNLSYLDVVYGTYPDGGSRPFVYTGYNNTDPTPHNIVIFGDTQSGDDMIADSHVSISDVSDSIAATTGFDGDNTIADFIGSIPQGSSATDVIGYVDKQVDAVEDVADKKTVYIVDNGATSAYAKVYSIYQGSTGSAASPVAGEKLIDINIPKDQVVESGSVADITFHDNKLWDGATDVTALIKGTGTPTAADAGKYIKLVLQNVTDPLYIAAQSLVDIYTAQPNATSVQLTISNTNEISAVIVDGAVTTAKIADDAVTAAKVAIAAHTESQTAGADGIAVSVTTTDGQVSSVSASIAANTYASAAQGALADTALQPADVQAVSTSDIEALFS